MSSPLLSRQYPGAQGYPQYAHQPAKYRFYDMPNTDIPDVTYTHPTNEGEDDTSGSSTPKLSETGLQLDTSIPGFSSPFLLPLDPPIEPLRDSGSVIIPTPPRPSQPFARNAGSFKTFMMELPRPASSIASSVVSELGPVRPGGEAARQDIAQRLRERRFIDIVTGGICCMHCQTFIPSPRTQDDASGTLLHFVCPSCPAVYCRGCTNPVMCDRNCNARHNCDVKRCCSEVRAVAIFQYLSAFDRFYLDACAAFHGFSDERILDAGQRSEFLNYVLSNAEQHENAYKFLSMLKRTVKWVYFWLLPEGDGNIVDCCVGPMLDVSFLPGIIYELIYQTRWQGRLRLPRFESMFEVIEKLIRTLSNRQDEDLTSVVYSPLCVIEQSRGLGAWLWDDDDDCVWSNSHIAGPSQTLAEWLPFLETLSQNSGHHVNSTSSSH